MIVKIILTAPRPGCALLAISHHAMALSDNWNRESPRHGCSGQSNLAQIVRVV
jgi:hypothetical protein